MTTSAENLRICPNGHRYYKSSDCPTCPVCESERKPQNNFMAGLGAPAIRALEHHGVVTIADLASRTEKEVAGYHGMGPKGVAHLKKVLEENGLQFAPGKPRK